MDDVIKHPDMPGAYKILKYRTMQEKDTAREVEVIDEELSISLTAEAVTANIAEAKESVTYWEDIKTQIDALITN